MCHHLSVKQETLTVYWILEKEQSQDLENTKRSCMFKVKILRKYILAEVDGRGV